MQVCFVQVIQVAVIMNNTCDTALLWLEQVECNCKAYEMLYMCIACIIQAWPHTIDTWTAVSSGQPVGKHGNKVIGAAHLLCLAAGGYPNTPMI